MTQQKRWIEVVLMPLVVALIGIGGTYFITKQQEKNAQILRDTQLESTQKLAEADRQLKILEIFADKIASSDEEQRKLALRMLRVVDGGLAEQIAKAVSLGEPQGSEVRKIAIKVAKEGAVREVLDAPKNNLWHGELVIFDPKTSKELATGRLMFGPTATENRISYARISFDKSSIKGLEGTVEATKAVWGFMGASTDSTVSMVFGNIFNTPIFVFNKITNNYIDGVKELGGVLFMKQDGLNNVFAHVRAICKPG